MTYTKNICFYQRRMPDYRHAKIYAIRCKETDDVYVGSTTQTLSMRMAGHRDKYRLFLSQKYNYITSFEVLKYKSAYIELLEEFPCENKEQLNKKEGEIIRSMKCVNRNIAGRNNKEYYTDNKEVITERRKAYEKANREVISKRSKAYRKANKDVIREYKNAWYEANRETVLEQRRLKYAAKKAESSQSPKPDDPTL